MSNFVLLRLEVQPVSHLEVDSHFAMLLNFPFDYNQYYCKQHIEILDTSECVCSQI